MTHLSLFSGIGGLDLAAEWAGFTTVGQCEYADYPYKVLCRHWPYVPKWRDIHELNAESFRERTGLDTVDCISGGFPCQPHSLAGKRKASGDERDLWPEMRRVIGDIKPRWVVDENVLGLLSSEDGRFFRGILRDFAQMGYDVGWGVISAAEAGAVHRRERVAIIAHSHGKSLARIRCDKCKTISGKKDSLPSERCAPFSNFGRLSCSSSVFQIGNNELDKPLITRMDDGFSGAMDRNKALGNAVVPQQFYPVFKAIYEAEKEKTNEKCNDKH